MNKVIDINSKALNVVFLSAKVSYAAIVDNNNNEIEITEEMIVEACESVDQDLNYPFAFTASR